MFLFAWQAAQEAKAKKEAEDKAQQEAEEKAKKEAEEKSKKVGLCVVSYPRFKVNYCFYLPGRLLKRRRPRRRPKTRLNKRQKRKLRRKLKKRPQKRRAMCCVVFQIQDHIVSICLVGCSRGKGQEGGRRQGQTGS